MRETPETRDLIERAIGEALHVGRARGIALGDECLQAALKVLDTAPADGTTSMQRDIASGRRSELEAQTGAIVRLGTTRFRHHDVVYAVTYSPDGSIIASASHDSTIRFWDPRSGRETRRLAGHARTVSSVSFTPDGKYLVSASWDNTLRVWDSQTGKTRRSYGARLGNHGVVAVSPSGQRVKSLYFK